MLHRIWESTKAAPTQFETSKNVDNFITDIEKILEKKSISNGSVEDKALKTWLKHLQNQQQELAGLKSTTAADKRVDILAGANRTLDNATEFLGRYAILAEKLEIVAEQKEIELKDPKLEAQQESPAQEEKPKVELLSAQREKIIHILEAENARLNKAYIYVNKPISNDNQTQSAIQRIAFARMSAIDDLLNKLKEEKPLPSKGVLSALKRGDSEAKAEKQYKNYYTEDQLHKDLIKLKSQMQSTGKSFFGGLTRGTTTGFFTKVRGQQEIDKAIDLLESKQEKKSIFRRIFGG